VTLDTSTNTLRVGVTQSPHQLSILSPSSAISHGAPSRLRHHTAAYGNRLLRVYQIPRRMLVGRRPKYSGAMGRLSALEARRSDARADARPDVDSIQNCRSSEIKKLAAWFSLPGLHTFRSCTACRYRQNANPCL